MASLRQYKEMPNGQIDYTFFYEGKAPFYVCETCGGIGEYKGLDAVGYNFEHTCTVEPVAVEFLYAEFAKLGGHEFALRTESPTIEQLRGLVHGCKKLLAERSNDAQTPCHDAEEYDPPICEDYYKATGLDGFDTCADDDYSEGY